MESERKWRWSEGERGRVSGVFIGCLPNSRIAFLVCQALSDMFWQVCPVGSQCRDEGTDGERRQRIEGNVHDLTQGTC